MTHALGQSVGLHHITWRATGSAVSDVDVLVEALAWLIGDPEAVKTDKSSSYHGPELTCFQPYIKQAKGHAFLCV